VATHKPAIDVRSVAALNRTVYPEPYRSRVLPREKRRLGDVFGIARFGVNHTTLPPGKESSMRHWHTREDEFVYVLEGEVVLRTGAGEQLLTAGMCVGFPAGLEDGHQLVNRSNSPAVYLEIGSRDPEDTAYYPDPDIDMVWNAPHARGKISRRDGTDY
jgi:uncharacterized cupin superfamily protein